VTRGAGLESERRGITSVEITDKTFSPGIAAIGLFHPQDNANIGSVLRAVFCYRADLIVIEGKKYHPIGTDTMKTFRHVPLIHSDLKNAAPYACIPIAVELIDGAQPINNFIHPRSAYYIFGPENGSLGRQITSWCKHTIYIPTRQCLNLAQTVNVILYDRMMKMGV
jgi:tRNA(Leu) C34 or U34 (ribose-2'-O)-methylase TrmL